MRREEDIARAVARATEAYGPIDLFCSNAGIGVPGGVEASGRRLAAHLGDQRPGAHLRRPAVLPGMLARGEGYLLQTASAAGLLTQIGSAPYAVTKHAAVALAEWLAMTHAEAGIGVLPLSPRRTHENADGRGSLLHGEFPGGRLGVAGGSGRRGVKGLDEERFLILPHPEVAEYFRRKADDYDRWLRGMRRLQSR